MNLPVTKTQCVYTIVNENVIKKAKSLDGHGEFQEGRPWASALKYKKTLGKNNVYPLLMANAASIIGVEWAAAIESIEVHGQSTFVKFSCLLDIADPIPLDGLVKRSNGKPLAKNYIRPYVPCLIDGNLEAALLSALGNERNGVTKRSRGDSFKRKVAEREIDADHQTNGAPTTVREALIEARIGQGWYRARLLEIWDGRCALTGCNLTEVLIASHAKPWAECNNKERLDEYNGLLLASHVDRLFDCGLISFTDDGEMLIKPRLAPDALSALGIVRDGRLRRVDTRHLPYLKAHRLLFGFE